MRVMPAFRTEGIAVAARSVTVISRLLIAFIHKSAELALLEISHLILQLEVLPEFLAWLHHRKLYLSVPHEQEVR